MEEYLKPNLQKNMNTKENPNTKNPDPNQEANIKPRG